MSKEVFGAHEWSDYIENRLKADQMERMEQALLDDPRAMEHYLEALDRQQQRPGLADPAHFAENVMARIGELESAKQKRVSRSNRRRRLLEHKVFHYAVAACLTLIFLSSGVFDRMAPYHKFQNEHGSSFTEKWTEAATSWLDRLKPKP